MQPCNTELALAKYRKPIHTYCYLYHRQARMELSDLESEMYEVLYRCVMKYNPDNGATFNTFLWQSIYNRFRTILRTNSAEKRKIVEVLFDHTVDGYVPDGESSPYEFFSAFVMRGCLTPGPDDLHEAHENVRERIRSGKKRLSRVA